MKKEINSVILSNGKMVRIYKQTLKKLDINAVYFDTADVLDALGLDRDVFHVSDLWPSEHETKGNDEAGYISETVLFHLPARNQSSFDQRKLIIEMIQVTGNERKTN